MPLQERKRLVSRQLKEDDEADARIEVNAINQERRVVEVCMQMGWLRVE